MPSEVKVAGARLHDRRQFLRQQIEFGHRPGHLQDEQRIPAAAPLNELGKCTSHIATEDLREDRMNVVVAEWPEGQVLDVGPFAQAGQELSAVGVEVAAARPCGADERHVGAIDTTQRDGQECQRLVVEPVQVVHDDAGGRLVGEIDEHPREHIAQLSERHPRIRG